MKIKVEPKLYNVLFCIEDCPWDRVCANHTTAGDFRTEGGVRPLLSLKNGEVFCETFHSSGDGYEYHEEPINRSHYYESFAAVCWKDLVEEIDAYEI